MIECVCEHCGKSFKVKYKCRLRKYCSHKCANVASAPVRKKERITHYCKICGNPINILESQEMVRQKISEIQYCSVECRSAGQKTGEDRICQVCGRIFYSTRNVYCSLHCKAIAQTNKYKRKPAGKWKENGYIVVYAGDGEGKKEHIIIMEKKIGRTLYQNEVVHHINGKRDDNRICNLALMTRGEHSALHRKMERGSICF